MFGGGEGGYRCFGRCGIGVGLLLVQCDILWGLLLMRQLGVLLGCGVGSRRIGIG